MKRVLILCTGNSCRSIIAEALANEFLKPFGVEAFSAGSRPKGEVNSNAKRVLEEMGAWSDRYRSKSVEDVMERAPFDLVVTVCDNAREECPIFKGGGKSVHIGFDDPDGKGYEAFVDTAKQIKERLLPEIKKELGI